MSKYFGRYLRTNYKVTGRELDADAIGEAIVKGSWGGGAGTKRWCGGFIMGSYNGAAVVSDCGHPISAAGAIASYYGSAPGWSDVTGFRIFPFMVKNASQPIGATASVFYEFHWSVSANDSCFYVIGVKHSVVDISGTGVAAATQAIGPATVLATGESVHFVWAGWIVSAP